jgi:ribonuclease Z
MTNREVSIEISGIPVRGRSAAGLETCFRLPTLRSALEAGRGPEELVAIPNLFVTHGHLDHCAGVATYASQRTLQGLSGGRVFVPAETLADYEALIALHLRLEGFDRYSARLIGVSPGDRVEIRSDLVVQVFRGSHRVATAGYTFKERKRKLRPEFLEASGDEIARLRDRGVEIAEEMEIPILSYPGDSDERIFDSAPEIFAARVLILECTFLRPGEEEKARSYGHLHLSDIVRRASDFRNDSIVLAHFSAKYSRDEILTRLSDGLPASLRDRVHPFI